jgi:hypothetical protein
MEGESLTFQNIYMKPILKEKCHEAEHNKSKNSLLIEFRDVDIAFKSKIMVYKAIATLPRLENLNHMYVTELF